MKAMTFSRKLRKIIESSDEFVVDTIDIMGELRRDARKSGFDDIIFVAGENEDQCFLVYIQKA